MGRSLFFSLIGPSLVPSDRWALTYLVRGSIAAATQDEVQPCSRTASRTVAILLPRPGGYYLQLYYQLYHVFASPAQAEAHAEGTRTKTYNKPRPAHPTDDSAGALSSEVAYLVQPHT